MNLLCHQIREHECHLGRFREHNNLQRTLPHYLLLLPLLLLLLLLSMLLLLVVLLIIALLLLPDNTQRASECPAKGGLEEELTGRESRLAGY